MNVALIGEQIAKFRKARELTQEELGRAVGVSTQAVSRWERGGAPDVSLLPAIADTLGVTTDALFGREGGAPESFQEDFVRWLASLDPSALFRELQRLMWLVCRKTTRLHLKLPIQEDYPDSCLYTPDDHTEPIFIGTQLARETGFLLGVVGQDMSFTGIFPEPEAGYLAYLAPCDEYRRLFSALAAPHALEILLDMAAEKQRFTLPVTVAKRLGIPQEEAAAAMTAMEKANLLDSQELELPEGVVSTYELSCTRNIIAFLYYARLMGARGQAFWYQLYDRKTPWLRRAGQSRNEDRYEESYQSPDQ